MTDDLEYHEHSLDAEPPPYVDEDGQPVTLPGPAFVSQADRDAADAQAEHARQAASYLNVVQDKTMDELIAEMQAQQQAEYDGRVEHARQGGDLVEYRESVLFGKPYAWVRYKGQRLRLLKLTQEGIVLPAS